MATEGSYLPLHGKPIHGRRYLRILLGIALIGGIWILVRAILAGSVLGEANGAEEFSDGTQDRELGGTSKQAQEKVVPKKPDACEVLLAGGRRKDTQHLLMLHDYGAAEKSTNDNDTTAEYKEIGKVFQEGSSECVHLNIKRFTQRKTNWAENALVVTEFRHQELVKEKLEWLKLLHLPCLIYDPYGIVVNVSTSQEKSCDVVQRHSVSELIRHATTNYDNMEWVIMGTDDSLWLTSTLDRHIQKMSRTQVIGWDEATNATIIRFSDLKSNLDVEQHSLSSAILYSNMTIKRLAPESLAFSFKKMVKDLHHPISHVTFATKHPISTLYDASQHLSSMFLTQHQFQTATHAPDATHQFSLDLGYRIRLTTTYTAATLPTSKQTIYYLYDSRKSRTTGDVVQRYFHIDEQIITEQGPRVMYIELYLIKE